MRIILPPHRIAHRNACSAGIPTSGSSSRWWAAATLTGRARRGQGRSRCVYMYVCRGGWMHGRGVWVGSGCVGVFKFVHPPTLCIYPSLPNTNKNIYKYIHRASPNTHKNTYINIGRPPPCLLSGPGRGGLWGGGGGGSHL